MLSQAITNLLVLEVANWLWFSLVWNFVQSSITYTFIHSYYKCLSAYICFCSHSIVLLFHSKIDWMNQQKNLFSSSSFPLSFFFYFVMSSRTILLSFYTSSIVSANCPRLFIKIRAGCSGCFGDFLQLISFFWWWIELLIYYLGS